MSAPRSYAAARPLWWLVLGAMLGACQGDGCSCGRKTPANYNGPSHMELLDIVQRYFYHPVRRDDLELHDPDIFERLEVTPQYQAWLARRREAWNKRDEWYALVVEAEASLPEFNVRNEHVPPMSSYEVAAWRKDAPEYTDGLIRTTLVVRVSYYAPLYEMYESSVRLEAREPAEYEDPDIQHWYYRDHRQNHHISPRFARAAEVFARLIEDKYGYTLADPTMLDMQLVNTAIWEEGRIVGTLREALFSTYRL